MANSILKYVLNIISRRWRVWLLLFVIINPFANLINASAIGMTIYTAGDDKQSATSDYSAFDFYASNKSTSMSKEKSLLVNFQATPFPSPTPIRTPKESPARPSKPTSTPLPTPPPADPKLSQLMIIVSTLVVVIVFLGVIINRKRV